MVAYVFNTTIKLLISWLLDTAIQFIVQGKVANNRNHLFDLCFQYWSIHRSVALSFRNLAAPDLSYIVQ